LGRFYGDEDGGEEDEGGKRKDERRWIGNW
jgi:hypothetical protein